METEVEPIKDKINYHDRVKEPNKSGQGIFEAPEEKQSETKKKKSEKNCFNSSTPNEKVKKGLKENCSIVQSVTTQARKKQL